MDMEKLDDRIHELLDQGRKVAAIKLVRRTTGWGLRKSKEYIDNLALAAQPAIGAAEEAALEKEVKALIQQDRFMEAIKLVRERTGWGLRECKTFVDNLLHSREKNTLDGTPSPPERASFWPRAGVMRLSNGSRQRRR